MITADLAAPDPSVLESDVHGADAVLSGLSRVEVFGPDSAINRHFTTGPVAGFLVDDIQDATAELRSTGVVLEHLAELATDSRKTPSTPRGSSEASTTPADSMATSRAGVQCPQPSRELLPPVGVHLGQAPP